MAKEKISSAAAIVAPFGSYRKFGTDGTLADLLHPYLENQLARYLNPEFTESRLQYNGDTHKTVPCQGGVA